MFVYFNFLNSNESFFYTLIKVIVPHLGRPIDKICPYEFPQNIHTDIR